MNISLTSMLQGYIEQKVTSGLYYSASEVVREALRLMISKESGGADSIASLNQEIQVGVDQIGRGEYVTSTELDQHIAERRRKFTEEK